MISYILEKLNKNKYFKYYLCTPWIYAIGTCSEQINVAHRIATKHNKIYKNIYKNNIFKIT